MISSRSASALLGRSGCAGCGRPGAPLCEPCEAALTPPTACAPLRGIRRVVAPWAYAGAARALVLALKLRGERPAAEPLVAAMRDAVARVGVAGGTITWVPGRRADIRTRGFDHAEVLARGVAAALGLTAEGLLERVGTPADQTTLPAAERRRNLLGAFSATPGGKEAIHSGVILVDDLVTTGATAASCAAALGASIEVVAAAVADR
jgi:predicted amidophosphoribosyltransferase